MQFSVNSIFVGTIEFLDGWKSNIYVASANCDFQWLDIFGMGLCLKD